MSGALSAAFGAPASGIPLCRLWTTMSSVLLCGWSQNCCSRVLAAGLAISLACCSRAFARWQSFAPYVHFGGTCMYLIFKASAKIHFLVVCVCFVATAVKLCDAAARRGGAPVAPVMEAVIDQACFCFFLSNSQKVKMALIVASRTNKLLF